MVSIKLKSVVTAFSENEHFEFRQMPFGFKNAPSTIQRVIDNISISLTHLSIKEVFKRLRNTYLKIQPDKCEFLSKELAYLDSVKPNPSKINSNINFTLPKNSKEIKSFLGLSEYYRRFTPNFAKTKPLTELL